MDLFKIHNDLVADRTGDAWFLVPSDGSVFHEQWQYGTGAAGGFAYVTSEHHSQAVCREEPRLTLAWGLDPWDGGPERHWEPDWASSISDPEVRPCWADLFWNNALIDCVTLLEIDGGRALIPDPGYDKTVSAYELALAELIADISDAEDSERPLRQVQTLGFATRYDHKRHGAGSQG